MKKILRMLLALALTLAVLAGCAQNAQAAWKEQYDLGMRLLSEQSYEEAILAFREAIRVDPKREEAYIGLADVYLAQGDGAAALAAVEEGIAQCGESDALTAKRDEVQATGSAETAQGEGYPLTEEQKAANLTGEEPFWEKDYADWEYSPSTTLYDLMENGLTIDPSIDLDELGKTSVMDKEYSSIMVRLEDPRLFVFDATQDLYLASVAVSSDPSIIGPRGIHVGMSAPEVLKLFYCSDEGVLQEAENGFPGIVGQDPETLLTMYNMDYAAVATLGPYGADAVALCYYIDNGARLDVIIKDGVVAKYSLQYIYPEGVPTR